MHFVSVDCSQCNKVFLKDSGHYKENIRFGHKFYCSLKCQGQYKTLSKKYACENPLCKKEFIRMPSATSSHNYCSHHCAAVVGNSNKTKKIHYCKNSNCNNIYTERREYCSIKCIPQPKSQYTKEKLIQIITNFAVENARIPTKQELMRINKPARKFFGTWNKAIIAAGLAPNPVMFAQKHIAKDGHKCDSMAERIIDDWLTRRGIAHERSVPYPGNLGFSVDFKVGDYWIEFFGLHGEFRRYDELMKQKLRLIKRSKLKLVAIYPKDLFPKPKLSEKLEFLQYYLIDPPIAS